MKPTFFISLLLVASIVARAEIQLEPVEYQHGETTLQGWRAFDISSGSKRPGVLIIHQWKGVGEYEKRRAEMLAALGYSVFALDIYGKGIRPASANEAVRTSAKFKEDRELFRARARAGLQQLLKHESTDPDRIAAIGYCFGGTGVLELARSGADIEGVVSFHGGLSTPTPEDAKNIKAKVLVLHGADDPYAPLSEVMSLIEEMKKGEVDYQVNLYGGAVHSFTDWGADSEGARYDEQADRRSWNEMKMFFEELFGKD